jgi:hypothetical protein
MNARQRSYVADAAARISEALNWLHLVEERRRCDQSAGELRPDRPATLSLAIAAAKRASAHSTKAVNQAQAQDATVDSPMRDGASVSYDRRPGA